MFKKLVVGVIAAGALFVPLAGLAGAAPDPATNPGTPGNLGFVPGQGVKTIAQEPGSTAGFFRDSLGFHSPGDAINTAAPGQLKKAAP
jgi:hypothetical protein